VTYLFLYAFISFVVARNVLFGIFIFIDKTSVLAGPVDLYKGRELRKVTTAFFIN
jgi:hypothetical protein